MVQEREKKLLDYLYEVGQQIRDYMRDNGYNEFSHNYVSIDVSIDKDATVFDKVTAWYFMSNKAEEQRGVKKEFMLRDQKPVIREVCNERP